MKKKTFLITISMILIVIAAKSQMWVTQNANPVNEGFNFISLSVVDSNQVLGIGTLIDESFENQFFYFSRTTDGGTNWITNALDTDWVVSSFQALSADTAWISTSSLYGLNSGSNYRTAIRKTTATWNLIIHQMAD